MDIAEVWGNRWVSCTDSISRKYMQVAYRKQSLVCLAADRATMAGLHQLIDEVGEHIAALKTHVDLVDDWSKDAWEELCQKAKEADLLIFEDRKFADIGKITNKQMGGIYDIRSWSDLVTSHLISGPDIVDGIQKSWNDIGREGGVLLLAQMSSRGNLLDAEYTADVIAVGRDHSGVFGFIGNGSNPSDISRLRKSAGEGKMIWTPGVNINVGDGELGQRYGSPEEAVNAGSDCIIVGSGIHKAAEPRASAKAYADASWNALINR